MSRCCLAIALLALGLGPASAAGGGGPELSARLASACAEGGSGCPLDQDGASLNLLQGRAAAQAAGSQEGRKQKAASAKTVSDAAEVVASLGNATLIGTLNATLKAALNATLNGTLSATLNGTLNGTMNATLDGIVAGSIADASGSRSSSAPSIGATCAWAAGAACLLGLAGITALSRQPGEKGIEALVAEFVGTFMLVLSVGCNVLVGDATWGVVSIACTLMVSIYALGGVSGAHLNPAVSVACLLTGKIAVREALMYVWTQLAAGLVASLVYSQMLGDAFNLGPAEGFSWWQAGLGELLYTFMLCFVVLNTACSKKHAGKEQFYGLAIGFSVVAGGYGAGSISGGCFNPAVAFGIDASSSSLGFGWCFAYLGFELLGAVLAAILFRACRPDDFGGSDSYGLGVRTLSEFLGTFMLVLTVGLNVIANSKAAVFSIAASLMCMIFALGSCSGAHFNPAVTTAIFLRGKCKLVEAVAFMAAQLTAGVAAAFTYSAMEGGKTVYLGPSGGSGEALLGEFVFTFLLSFVVLSVATVKSPLSEYFGLAIGSCVTAGGLAVGSLSGGSLNPAVSAGLAISDLGNGGSAAHLPSYAAVEILGGVLAAGIFSVTRPEESVKA